MLNIPLGGLRVNIKQRYNYIDKKILRMEVIVEGRGQCVILSDTVTVLP